VRTIEVESGQAQTRRWTFATSVLWVLGTALAAAVLGTCGRWTAWIATGTAIGAVQWWFLRRLSGSRISWLVTTGSVWAFAALVAIPLTPAAVAAVPFLFVAVAQIIFLREPDGRSPDLGRVSIWIVVAGLGWAAMGTATLKAVYALDAVGLTSAAVAGLGGAVLGALTGALMPWVLSHGPEGSVRAGASEVLTRAAVSLLAGAVLAASFAGIYTARGGIGCSSSETAAFDALPMYPSSGSELTDDTSNDTCHSLFDTTDSPGQVVAYYREMLPRAGWHINAEPMPETDSEGVTTAEIVAVRRGVKVEISLSSGQSTSGMVTLVDVNLEKD
jgi:hypothetical protein